MLDEAPTSFRPVDASASPDLSRTMLTHAFQVSDGFASPVKLWLAHGRPGLTPVAAADLLIREGETELGLDRDTLEAACRDLCGEPTPPDGQLYPGMDYVLTTPEPGVYLSVRLGGHVTDRFGYGCPQPMWAALCDEPRPGPTPLRERLRAALTATLDAIRAAAPEAHPVARSTFPGAHA